MLPSHERQRLYLHHLEIERRRNTEAIVSELYQSWNTGKKSGILSCTDYCADPTAVNHLMNKVDITVSMHRTKTGRYAPHAYFPGLEHNIYELTFRTAGIHPTKHHTIPNPLMSY